MIRMMLMDACTMDGWVHEWMDGCMNGWMNGTQRGIPRLFLKPPAKEIKSDCHSESLSVGESVSQ